MIYIVEYTNEACTGNQTLTMEISAANLAEAWEIVEAHYPYLAVDNIFAADRGYADI